LREQLDALRGKRAPPRPVAVAGSRRIRHPQVGGPLQQPPPHRPSSPSPRPRIQRVSQPIPQQIEGQHD
jgi:hypothetical protein